MAIQHIADAIDWFLIVMLSEVTMPGMSGLELLPKVTTMRPEILPEFAAAHLVENGTSRTNEPSRRKIANGLATDNGEF